MELNKITGRDSNLGIPLNTRPNKAKGRLVKKIDITATALSEADLRIKFQQACRSAEINKRIKKSNSTGNFP